MRITVSIISDFLFVPMLDIKMKGVIILHTTDSHIQYAWKPRVLESPAGFAPNIGHAFCHDVKLFDEACADECAHLRSHHKVTAAFSLPTCVSESAHGLLRS